MDRNEPQPGRQPNVGEHFQRLPLIVQQSLRHTKQNTDHAILATPTTHCAVVAIDHHGAGIQRPVGPHTGICHRFVLSFLLLSSNSSAP